MLKIQVQIGFTNGTDLPEKITFTIQPDHLGTLFKLLDGLLEYCQLCRRLVVDCSEKAEAIAASNKLAAVPWNESAMKGSMD